MGTDIHCAGVRKLSCEKMDPEEMDQEKGKKVNSTVGGDKNTSHSTNGM